MNLHACKLIYIDIKNKSSLNYIIFCQFLDFAIRYWIRNSHGIFCSFWDFVNRLPKLQISKHLVLNLHSWCESTDFSEFCTHESNRNTRELGCCDIAIPCIAITCFCSIKCVTISFIQQAITTTRGCVRKVVIIEITWVIFVGYPAWLELYSIDCASSLRDIFTIWGFQFHLYSAKYSIWNPDFCQMHLPYTGNPSSM